MSATGGFGAAPSTIKAVHRVSVSNLPGRGSNAAVSALFVSHSSADNAIAADLVARLGTLGHRSVFLDFDPQLGIPAGRQWEQELYARLRACRAVIVLCSPASMASPWCFAEITHARALGKLVLPLKVAPCTVSALLGDVQVTDFTTDPDDGFARLTRSLAAAGLDPKALFEWDGQRPPYPGLLAFERADAAVYFGREAAIDETLETLARMQRLGGARLLLELGASGSGKSSLLRAGVVPRLARDADRWLIAEPFRPAARPFDALALALATLASPHDRAADPTVLRDELRSDLAAARWNDRLMRWRHDAGRSQATLLIVVDQFEELLASQDAGEADAFLRLVAALATDGPAGVLLAATLRSDFLGAFQTHPALAGVRHESVLLAPMANADMAEVIEGPARVAGLALEAGLAGAMLADTASSDALPLLAFALRELWDRYGAAGTFTLAHYRDDLGGLQGALARAAEGVFGERVWPASEVDALRRALLGLVRIDADGRALRQPRPWAELPATAHALLERLVQARLLVSRSDDRGERVIEVAHEALLRSWDRLVVWLNADRDFLQWRERVRGAEAQWARIARDDSLLLRGPLLAEAQRWLATRATELDDATRAFVVRSADAARDQEADRRKRTRRRMLMATTAVGLVAIAGALAAWQWRAADQQRRIALARQLNLESNATLFDDPVAALELTIRSMRAAWTAEGHDALQQAVSRFARPVETQWKPLRGAVRAMAASPDGQWLAAGGQGELQLQRLGGEARTLPQPSQHHTLHSVAFSPDGRWLAAACEPASVCLFDRDADWKLVHQWPIASRYPGKVSFSADGRQLATHGYREKGVIVLAVPPVAGGARTIATEGDIAALAFSPMGSVLAVTGARTELISTNGSVHPRLPRFLEEGARQLVAFSPDGKRLGVAASGPLWLIPTSSAGDADGFTGTVIEGGGSHSALAFSPDGTLVALAHERAALRVVDQHGRLTALAPPPAAAVLFGAPRQVLVGGMDGRITAWDTDGQPLRRLALPQAATAVALSADGRHLAVGFADGGVQLLDPRGTGAAREFRLPGWRTDTAADAPKMAIALDAGARWLAAVAGSRLWLIETARGRTFGPIEHDESVTTVAFSPDGHHVATSAAWSGNVVWDQRANVSRRLRVWRLDDAGLAASSYVIAADPRRAGKGFRVDGKATQVEAASAIRSGDAKLADAAAHWPIAVAANGFSKSGFEVTPAEKPWLDARLANGKPLVDTTLHLARWPLGSDSALAAFSADGRSLAVAQGRVLLLWPLHPDELLAEACTRLLKKSDCVG